MSLRHVNRNTNLLSGFDHSRGRDLCNERFARGGVAMHVHAIAEEFDYGDGDVHGV